MYGPNVPIMLGLKTQLETDGKKIVPAERYGLQVVSMGFLTAGRRAGDLARADAARRDPAVLPRRRAGTTSTTCIVDMPPGTGDVALSLSQSVPVAGAVLVTTPQTVSLADTRRAVADVSQAQHSGDRPDREHEPLRVPGLRHESDIFGKGGGERWRQEMTVPFLGSIPLYEPVRRGGDRGVPIVIGEPDSAAGARDHCAPPSASRSRSRSRRSHARAIPLTRRVAGLTRGAASDMLPFTKTHAAERSRRHRPRRSAPAARRRQRLVPRRIEERAARARPGWRICSST